eukprot:9327851-Heterocapsa_arctica.AAC.1
MPCTPSRRSCRACLVVMNARALAIIKAAAYSSLGVDSIVLALNDKKTDLAKVITMIDEMVVNLDKG